MMIAHRTCPCQATRTPVNRWQSLCGIDIIIITQLKIEQITAKAGQTTSTAAGWMKRKGKKHDRDFDTSP
jgi:hypothetical protein